MKWLKYTALVLFSFVLFSNPLQARTPDTESVPDALKSWIPWVTQDSKDQLDCPFLYNYISTSKCVWPSSLLLNLEKNGANFTQTWKIYKSGWISLPGNKKNWPQSVTINGQLATVSLHQNKPSLYLEPGEHKVKGVFLWEKLPEVLEVPFSTGIVSLNVNGEGVKHPDLEKGKLWIRQRQKASKQEDDRVTLKVYRHVLDSIPVTVTTRLQFKVSGKQREIIIGNPLLQGFIPLQLISHLPAKLEQDNLRIQVRPGTWEITLVSRHMDPVKSLTMPAGIDGWPGHEIWVFKEQNQLRVVEIEGINSIDPRQTQLPEIWRSLPTYQMKPGDKMFFKESKRGDADPAPDQLSLNRNIWLQFDGGGYTVQDTVTGTKTSGWRLNAQPVYKLGRVSVDDQPQFITKLGENFEGVEVRQGNLNLTAEGIFIGKINQLPAIGWDHDFKQVDSKLQLPPGWKLFSVSGVDNVPDSWIQKWTLLDLFLVLIIAISIARLWSWKWGVFALISVGLIWHEPSSPSYILLFLLPAIALLRVLPDGKIKKMIGYYQKAVYLGLIIIVVPFMIDQVRTGLYPQLEQSWNQITPHYYQYAGGGPPGVYQDKAAVSQSVRKMQRVLPAPMARTKARMDSYVERDRSTKNLLLGEVDPNANVQTGPGLPQWKWKTISLSWNGPVEKEQAVSLMLLSPTTNLMLNIMRVILVSILCILLLGIKFKGTKGSSHPGPALSILAGLVSMPLLMGVPSGDTLADIPSPELLQELKTRVLKKPQCLPNCAQSSKMSLSMNSDSMEMVMEFHALEDVAVPLPGVKKHWLAQEVFTDGKIAKGLFLSKKGILWLDIKKGITRVNLRGALPNRNSIQLPLNIVPGFVETKLKGWTVAGLHENGNADSQLQLTRIRTESEKALSKTIEPGVLPPFVKIERTLRLGLDWRVDTTVIRVSPSGTAVVIEVPLLKGESVTSADVRTKNGNVLVNMGANKSYFTWSSQLAKTEKIVLTSPVTSSWVEAWRADISPILHANTKGIPVIQHTSPNGQWFPTWQPWPGESVEISIVQPTGVAGQTRTIDQSNLVVKPGKRSMESNLNFRLRSSRGGQHTIALPLNAELQDIKIDGKKKSIRQTGNKVTIPVHPGSQVVDVTWRNSTELSASFTSPAIDLGSESVNHSINVKMPDDRWLLFVNGPRMGPAVLFWGELIVVVLISLGLGRIKFMPLKSWHWMLLGIGLTQSSMTTIIIIVGWLFAIAFRQRMKDDISKFRFNITQIAFSLLTVTALFHIFAAVENGLLGYPDMLIAGNMSSAGDLKWYQDIADSLLPTSWVLSVPLVFYRGIMLLWSLWLAFALLGWVKWSWKSFSAGSIWRPIEFKFRKNKSSSKEVEQVAGDSN